MTADLRALSRVLSHTAGTVTPFGTLGQALAAGLVDAVAMDVAPVVLGRGKPFFGSYAGTMLFDDPVDVVRGDRVLHVRYRVQGHGEGSSHKPWE